jgi:hypothetical protein
LRNLHYASPKSVVMLLFHYTIIIGIVKGKL